MSGRAARRATAYLSARTHGCCCTNSTRIGIVSAPALDYPGGIADRDGVRLDVFHDYRSRPDDAPGADMDARQDARPHSDPAVRADLDGSSGLPALFRNRSVGVVHVVVRRVDHHA